LLGTSIGNYTVTALIGQGGMGAVYLAEHAMLGRRAAVKVLLPELSTNHEIVARFFNEARALTALRHPSIVEILDFGYLPDTSAYIIMEYLEGESLAARCHRLQKLEPRRALTLTRQIAGALLAAHERSIVHRDLKPDNIFLVPDPEIPGGERIKVLDFGIAKLATPGDHSRTQTGSVLGTPTYMSPEQCRGAGSVDSRADFYALGCVLYETLCGRPPFISAGIGDLIAHHLYFAPPTPRSLDPTIPETVEQLVLALLQKDPAARPQTARDLIEAIDRVLGGGSYAGPAAVPGAHDAPTLMVEIAASIPVPVARSGPTPVAGSGGVPLVPLVGGASPTPAGSPPGPASANTAMTTMPLPASRTPAPPDSRTRSATPALGASGTRHPQLPTPTPTTTLSGAAGMTSRSLPQLPARKRWVIPLVAGSLITVGAAVTVLVGMGGHDDRIVTPAGPPVAAPESPPAPSPTTPSSTKPPTTPSSTTPPTTPSSTAEPSADPSPAHGAEPGTRPAEPAPAEPAPAPASSPPAEPPPAPAPPPVRAVDKIALTVDSAPAGASVLVGGKPVGTTPFRESIEPIAGARVYTLEKSGYEPATVTLATDRAGSQRIALKKKRVRPGRGSADSVGDKGVNPFD
jgi:eukaryotic-like serine/threonine-protein kinase